MTCDQVADLLLDHVEGLLDPDVNAQVQEHVVTCAACRAKRADLRRLVGDLSFARSVDRRSAQAEFSSPGGLPPRVIESGRTIGDFEIIEELGRGGMGIVYRSRQITLNRVVALKVLSTLRVDSEQFLTRFAREAQAAARLHHTNIVPVYAQGNEGGYFYYAMELIEGPSLDQVLKQQRTARDAAQPAPSGAHPAIEASNAASRWIRTSAGMLRSAASNVLARAAAGPIAHRDFKQIARQIAGVAEGLHHAHQQGVIHRDIKPQNLMLGRDNELHITDFGLARLLDEPSLTQSSEMLGTPAYMAPEQITGGSPIDARTDVCALGVTLYEMLALERPFNGTTHDQVIYQILHHEPRLPRKFDPRIPVDLETICLRAIEKAPSARFASAADMAQDLRRYAQDFPIASRRISLLGRSARWARRNPAKATAFGLTPVVLLLLLLALSLFRSTGNASIDNAYAILLDNYRERTRAVQELGWTAQWFGDDQRRSTVTAFADIRADPLHSIELLRDAIERWPNDPDAHALLAWAYTRVTNTQGKEAWADARHQVDRADQLVREGRSLSAAGQFFRGQAVWGYDPEDAIRGFDLAIEKASRDEGFTFTQAMLHQARAMNQILYSWRGVDPLRAIRFYEKAVSRLENAADAQPRRAYPRYLLAITHYLAAETYRANDQHDDAETAYQKSWEAAEAAQVAQPTSPRGYAAKASYHESRGEFAKAVAVWNHYDRDSITKTASDKAERFEYEMRLHFWLGQYAQARETWRKRFGPECEYDPNRYDVNETFCGCLIAASLDDWVTARALINAAVEASGDRTEPRLLIHATCELLGLTPPPGLLPTAIPADAKLAPGWSAPWAMALSEFVGGTRSEAELLEIANSDTPSRDDIRFRTAAAYFHIGVRALTAGKRDDAIRAFDASHRQFDNEDYTFRAKLVLMKLKQDATWAAWSHAPAEQSAP